MSVFYEEHVEVFGHYVSKFSQLRGSQNIQSMKASAGGAEVFRSQIISALRLEGYVIFFQIFNNMSASGGLFRRFMGHTVVIQATLPIDTSHEPRTITSDTCQVAPMILSQASVARSTCTSGFGSQ